MKVVCVVPAYLPSRIGAWIATHGYLRALAARGHDVHVRTLFGYDVLREVDGVKVAGVGPSVYPHIKDADVCMSHAGDDRSMAADNARLLDVPHVTIVHSAHNPRPRPHTDLVVFNSHASRDVCGWDLPSIVARPPVRVEDHMVDNSGADRVTLINLAAEKGGQIFRRIAKREVRRRFVGVRGAYGAQVRVAERNIQVIRTQPDLLDVWTHTRVLLMPSAHESWGMVGVEAMCSGIPVIAHPTPGLRESLGDAGIFVRREDIDGWVRQIRRMDDPTIYAEASERAKARAEEIAGFDDVDRFCDEMEARFG